MTDEFKIPNLDDFLVEHDKLIDTEMQKLFTNRRKAAKKLMCGAERKHLEQYRSEGDPLPAKGEPVMRFLLSQSDVDNDDWYSFHGEAWEAGAYCESDDSDYFMNWVVDLDTGEFINVVRALCYYVGKAEGATWPQPEVGHTRLFFYLDLNEGELEAVAGQLANEHWPMHSDILGNVMLHKLAGEMTNSDDKED